MPIDKSKRMKRILWKTKSGKVLLDFVNAPTPYEASLSLIKNIGSDIGIQKPKECKSEYEQLRKLFKELSTTTDLNDCPTIHDYTAYYHAIRPPIVVWINGSLGEDLPFRDTGSPDYTDVLTYCVIKFLMDDRNVKLIYRCENSRCGRYFKGVAARPKQGENRTKYCSKSCSAHCKEKRRIARGYHRDHKREKRKDPDAPISYHGYKV